MRKRSPRQHVSHIVHLHPAFHPPLNRPCSWKIDSDLDPLRGDPRFEAMIEGAEARLAKSSSTRSP
jgi:hypothetical protein